VHYNAYKWVAIPVYAGRADYVRMPPVHKYNSYNESLDPQTRKLALKAAHMITYPPSVVDFGLFFLHVYLTIQK